MRVFASGLAVILLAVPAPLGAEGLLRKESNAAVDVNSAGDLLHSGSAEESVGAEAEALDAMLTDLCKGDVTCMIQHKEEWRIGMELSSAIPAAAGDKSLSAPGEPSLNYDTYNAWHTIMGYMPSYMQWTQPSDYPQEAYWPWHGHDIHVDRYPRPESPVKLLMLHGVGTNGRMMSVLLGRHLAQQKGIETIALDCLGYGVTRPNRPYNHTYDDWIHMLQDFIEAEHARDGRPIILYGLSAGGALAYHVACGSDKVKGIVGMCFLNMDDQTVRSAASANDFWGGPITSPVWKALGPTAAGLVPVPIRFVTKMDKIANKQGAVDAFLTDPTSGAALVNDLFLGSFMFYQMPVQPEVFRQCPILHTQPAEDRWVSLEISQIFTSRLKETPFKMVMLENAGHYPLEEPGISQLHEAVYHFVRQQVPAGWP